MRFSNFARTILIALIAVFAVGLTPTRSMAQAAATIVQAGPEQTFDSVQVKVDNRTTCNVDLRLSQTSNTRLTPVRLVGMQSTEKSMNLDSQTEVTAHVRLWGCPEATTYTLADIRPRGVLRYVLDWNEHLSYVTTFNVGQR